MVECRLFHVLLEFVSQSDTDSGVHFALAPTVQKVADRRIVSMSLCAAIPLADGPHGFSPYTDTCNGNVMAHVFPHFRHYVHVLKDRGHG